MSYSMRSILPVLATALALALPAAADAAVPATTPVPATNFVNSVGVNVHTGYYDTAYNNFAAVKSALLNLAVVPVYGPSLVQSTSYSAAGDLSGSLDCGNLHPYPGGALPTAVLFTDLTLEKLVAGNKPVCVTESGYHNATSTTDGHLPAS